MKAAKRTVYVGRLRQTQRYLAQSGPAVTPFEATWFDSAVAVRNWADVDGRWKDYAIIKFIVTVEEKNVVTVT